MKIAIVSDTHDNLANFLKIIDWLNREKIKIILHCGDICNQETINGAEKNFKGEIKFVRGNGDFKLENIPEKMEIELGGKTIAHGTNPTAVAAGDRTNWYFNRHGIAFVIGGHPNTVSFRVNYTAAQTDTAIITAGAGTKIVVTRCSVMVDNACTVDVVVRIGFGTASTPTGTGVVLSHPGIAAGSGEAEGVGSGIIGVGADGEDLRITSEVPTGGSIDVTISYYTIES
jgi:putative phosphoesterase